MTTTKIWLRADLNGYRRVYVNGLTSLCIDTVACPDWSNPAKNSPFPESVKASVRRGERKTFKVGDTATISADFMVTKTKQYQDHSATIVKIRECWNGTRYTLVDANGYRYTVSASNLK